MLWYTIACAAKESERCSPDITRKVLICQMQQWIVEFMREVGYWAVALLIAIENIFPPIPSEVILTFGGFMTSHPGAQMQIWLVVVAATAGSVAGAIVLYGLGRLLSPERLGSLIDRWGKYLRLKREDVEKAEKWFQKHGRPTVFFCRFIPIVRSLISIPAGMASMPLGQFLLLTTIGTAIWNTVLVYLGAVMGERWGEIVAFMNTYSHITLAVLGVAVIGFGIWFFTRRGKAANHTGDK